MTNLKKYITRFVDKVSPCPNTGCHLWGGAVQRGGYGALMIGSSRSEVDRRRTVAAHRFAYAVFVGPIPDGFDVCHKCDNPGCVNPDHLFVGTTRENVLDMHRKGRAPDVWRGKFSRSEEAFIAASDMRGVDLARRFGCRPETISRIRARNKQLQMQVQKGHERGAAMNGE